VRVEAEAVIPEGDSSEPCLEPSTLRWLDELQKLADEGDWLRLARSTCAAPRSRLSEPA
jgi:hypothetical protein